MRAMTLIGKALALGFLVSFALAGCVKEDPVELNPPECPSGNCNPQYADVNPVPHPLGDGGIQTDVCSGPSCLPVIQTDLAPGVQVDATEPPLACRDSDCQEWCVSLGFDLGRCNPSLTCSCSDEQNLAEEICDGIDNNGNGGVDEGCECVAGATQVCFTGDPQAIGLGQCRAGVQTCSGIDTALHWGSCEGEVLPSPEVCDQVDNNCDGAVDNGIACDYPCMMDEGHYNDNCFNGVDDDCDGLADCADPECSPEPECQGVEHCSDGIDNDGDGEFDCEDPDCEGVACGPDGMTCLAGVCACIGGEIGETNCTDGVDNDCDGMVDCEDHMDCVAYSTAIEICGNGTDDDCDGLVDCEDPDCAESPPREDCNNDVDDDCDGRIDCEDNDCNRDEWCSNLFCCVPGMMRWCDTPLYCSWGVQVCLPDGNWGNCEEVYDHPEGCGTYYYNRNCCERADQCCQNFPMDNASVGQCEGIAAPCE